MEQMTWLMVLSHANQMYKLAEEERISGTGPTLVFIYDELLRKSIATRAEWGDPSLDLMTGLQDCSKQAFRDSRTSGTKTAKTRTAGPRTGLRLKGSP